MKLKPLKKLTGLDYVTGKLFGFIEEFIAQLTPNPFLTGNLLEISVTTTATAFNHGLSATPQGWILVDNSANVTVWRTAWDERSITLDASGSSSIKVWVY